MNILLADDHALLRQTLASVLQEPPLEAVVTEAANQEEVRRRLDELSDIDLAIIDLHMPPCPGLDGLQALLEAFPDTRVLVLSGLAQPADVGRLRRAGVAGFLSKDISRDTFVEAIEQIMAGRPFFSEIEPAADATAGMQGLNGTLTPRQSDVVRLMAEGQTNKEIARSLGLSPATVKIHAAMLLKALKAANRTEAVRLALEAGLLSQDRSPPQAP